MHCSQDTLRSTGGLSEGDEIGLDGGLLLRGDAVLEATLAKTVVASVGEVLAASDLVYECCRLIAGGVIVAAVRGLLLRECAAMLFDRRYDWTLVFLTVEMCLDDVTSLGR
jgi:hypothetical protein